MLHDYKIEVDNSKQLKDNTLLDCSMELSFLNNLFRENLITEIEGISVVSEVGDQPFNEEILQGAKNRVKNLKNMRRKIK